VARQLVLPCSKLALVVLGTALLAACNHAFYFPSRRVFYRPTIEYESVRLNTPDGERLHGLWFPPSPETRARGTVVQFHGNAGNVTSNFPGFAWLTEHGYAFFTFDYRGYGRSTGQPSRALVRSDALTAIRWVQERTRAEAAPDLVLYGQSLGGAILLSALEQLRDRRRIAAVIIEGSFHSYEEAAASIFWNSPLLFPFTGFAYALVDEQLSPGPAVPRVSPIPLLVIHDARDPLVSVRSGIALFRAARPPKTLWVIDNARHLGALDDPDVRQALLAWIADQKQLRSMTKDDGDRLSR
jgi:alpha-beta hydrolase superfamily lysophospholipase